MAAAIHPAGARGLAGLTSAVQNQLALRDYQRQIDEDRQLGTNVSNFLQTPTGKTISGPDMGDVYGPPSPKPQLLSDLLTPGEAGFIKMLGGTKGQGRTAATTLGSIIARPPQKQIVTIFDPDTKTYRQVVKDLSTIPTDTDIGAKQPYTPFSDLVQQLPGGPGAPSGAIPAPPAVAPPPLAPGSPIPTPAPGSAPPAPMTAPGSSGLQNPPLNWRISTNEKGENQLQVSPGTTTTKDVVLPHPITRQPMQYQVTLDQFGRPTGPPQFVGEGMSDAARQKLESLAENFNVERGTPEWNRLIAGLAALPTDERTASIRYQELQDAFGRRPFGAPQQGAVAPAGRAGTPAPVQAPQTPTQAPPVTTGPPPAAAPRGGPSYAPAPGAAPPAPPQTGVPRGAADVYAQGRQQQIAEDVDRYTREQRARVQVEQTSPMDPTKSSNMTLPDGRLAPANLSPEQYRQLGAREIPTAKREEIFDMGKSLAQVDALSSMANRLILAQPGVGNQTQQWINLNKAALTQSSSLAAAYQKEVAAWSSLLTKGVGADTGMLSNQDQQRTVQGLPTFWDTAETRDLKMGIIRNIVQTTIDGKRAAIFGDRTYEDVRAATQQRIEGLLQQLEAVHEAGKRQPTEADRAAARREAKNSGDNTLLILKRDGFQTPGPTEADADQARSLAGGNPDLAVEILKRRGFDPFKPVVAPPQRAPAPVRR